MASQTFDISVWQMLAPLLVGGRVEIFPDEVVLDPARLIDGIARGGITVVQTVPSQLRVLVEEAGRGERAELQLRWMIPNGEVLPPELCRDWLRLYPSVPLVNAYGPTECSDDVSHELVREWRPEERAVRVSIGRPIANQRLQVVDRLWAPLPMGVTGELCVSGIGVGRGYLGEPARTAEVFVPDPFAAVPGARMYRTGDLISQLADGRLDFHGRIDHQVKVRGFRIELGEIETALAQHPGVRQAVVVARELAAVAGGAALVAYVVPAGEPVPSAAELRDFVGERLPEYMVPAAVVLLAAFPLSSNGKVDRKALPAPEASQLAATDEYLAPRNRVEEQLAGIWAELLGRERVGVHDDFFHLGGHSLLAARVVSRVREAFRVELPLATFFAGPTLGELAETIAVAQWAVGPAAVDAAEDLEVGEL
jgi:acyl-coenzyme A synthetase/AMP-(fatty) acid ligase/acyl carrier protein